MEVTVISVRGTVPPTSVHLKENKCFLQYISLSYCIYAIITRWFLSCK